MHLPPRGQGSTTSDLTLSPFSSPTIITDFFQLSLSLILLKLNYYSWTSSRKSENFGGTSPSTYFEYFVLRPRRKGPNQENV
ncbi:rabenosyn-5 [Biomphalaria glabrata]